MSSSAKNVSSNSTAIQTPSADVFSNFANQMSSLVAQSRANSAESARQAEIQRNWQAQQNKIAMDFNAAEAAKTRDWQQMMSNTAHQREIADLKAAGLNPILSASGGNGAAVTSGATASGVTSSGAKGDVDTSANSAIVGLLSSVLTAQTQLESQRMSALSNQAIADKNNASAQLIAQINGLFAGDRQEDSQRHAEYMEQHYPSSAVKAVGGVLEALTGNTIGQHAAKQIEDTRNILSNFPIIGKFFSNGTFGDGRRRGGGFSSNTSSAALQRHSKSR